MAEMKLLRGVRGRWWSTREPQTKTRKSDIHKNVKYKGTGRSFICIKNRATTQKSADLKEQ